MPRFFTEAQAEEFADQVVRVDLLVSLFFKSETKHLWNGHSELTINGDVYLPTHGTASIDGLDFSGNGAESQVVTLTVSGLPGHDNSLLAEVLGSTDEVNDRLGRIAVQLFDDDFQPWGAPAPIYWGVMQPPTVTRTTPSPAQGSTQTVSMDLENVFYNRGRPTAGLYADRDQKIRHPGDRFLEFTPTLLFRSFTYPKF